jgi:hypothetical protein
VAETLRQVGRVASNQRTGLKSTISGQLFVGKCLFSPSQVRTLLQRCLEKDPRRRLRDIGDARIELDVLAASRFSSATDTPGAEERAQARKDRTGLRRLALGGAVVALIALDFAAATWLRPAEESVGAVQMTAFLPPGISVTRGPGRILSVALSPAGDRAVHAVALRRL